MKRFDQLISQQKAINESMEEARILEAELIEIGKRFREETGTDLEFDLGRDRYVIKPTGVFDVKSILSDIDPRVSLNSELRRIHTYLTSEVPE